MKKLIKILVWLSAGIFSLMSVSCSRMSPLGPEENVIKGKIAQSTKGPILILPVASQYNYFRKGDDSTFYAEKFIEAEEGGKIKVGNIEYGKSSIFFPEDALPEDMLISFSWAPSGTLEGTLSDVEFGPHGTYFNKPVELKLSYKMADLSGVNENSLHIYYYNEDTGLWELIGGTINKKKKYVEAELWHFSRYAFALSRN